MKSKIDRTEQKIKQIEAQKESAHRAGAKIEDKSSQAYGKIESSTLEFMPKDNLELNRCGSNHSFYKKRKYLTNSNKADLDTKGKRTVFCKRLKKYLQENKKK